jgi:hypothetical protein
MSRRSSVAAILAVSTALLACGAGGGSKAETPSNRVEAPGLGLAIANLPDGLEVTTNEGGTLMLVPKGKAGTIVVQAGPAEVGPNLVAAVKEHQASIEARPGAEYLGVRELVTPLGSAYWSRGRYEQGGSTVEETRIVTLHPDGHRLLYLTSTYPAGDDSSARIQELLALLTEIEGTKPAGS